MIEVVDLNRKVAVVSCAIEQQDRPASQELEEHHSVLVVADHRNILDTCSTMTVALYLNSDSPRRKVDNLKSLWQRGGCFASC